MSRPKISRSKLEEFIQTATELSQRLESRDGYSMSPSLYDKELLKRINKACKFLREAHDARIINLDMMNCISHAHKDVHIIKHRYNLIGSQEIYITPKGEDYSSKPFQPNITLSSSRQFFADAVRHSSKMAKAIQNEPKQLSKKGGKVSQRITQPYKSSNTEWQPAKLAA